MPPFGETGPTADTKFPNWPSFPGFPGINSLTQENKENLPGGWEPPIAPVDPIPEEPQILGNGGNYPPNRKPQIYPPPEGWRPPNWENPKGPALLPSELVIPAPKPFPGPSPAPEPELPVDVSYLQPPGPPGPPEPPGPPPGPPEPPGPPPGPPQEILTPFPVPQVPGGPNDDKDDDDIQEQKDDTGIRG